jgi:hypothetical protein
VSQTQIRPRLSVPGLDTPSEPPLAPPPPLLLLRIIQLKRLVITLTALSVCGVPGRSEGYEAMETVSGSSLREAASPGLALCCERMKGTRETVWWPVLFREANEVTFVTRKERPVWGTFSVLL